MDSEQWTMGNAGAGEPLRWQRPEAGQVSVESHGEKARPAYLAVADHINAGILLIKQGQVHRVIQCPFDVSRPILASLGCGQSGMEPTRPSVGAGHAGWE